MPLNPAEELKLSEYFKLYGISKYTQVKVRQIAEMSKDGSSIKNIHAVVGGSIGNLTEHRGKLRRWGVW